MKNNRMDNERPRLSHECQDVIGEKQNHDVRRIKAISRHQIQATHTQSVHQKVENRGNTNRHPFCVTRHHHPVMLNIRLQIYTFYFYPPNISKKKHKYTWCFHRNALSLQRVRRTTIELTLFNL